MAKTIIRLIISLVICQLAGILGSIFTTPSIPTWYASLKKPSFTPPNWLFAPVWIFLFFLMGISLFLIGQKGIGYPLVKRALLIFFIQLIFNILWSFLFFGLKSPLFGFIEIILLWVLILLTIIFFLPISKIAGLLLLPYLIWVSWATVLNFAIWRLNPFG